MATLTSLELLREQVRADEGGADDTILSHYLQSAEEMVIAETNRELAELAPEGKLPARLTQAILMLAAHWYNQREAVGGANLKAVPLAYDSLVRPFIKLV